MFAKNNHPSVMLSLTVLVYNIVIVAGMRTKLCGAMRITPDSPVDSNAAMNYAIAIHLFPTLLCNCLNNFSSKNK